MKNAINWFEIPTNDFERAQKFYSEVLDVEVKEDEMEKENVRFGVFPFDMQNGGIGGAIVKMEGFTPSAEGSVVYLNGGDDLSVPLSRVEAAGGKVLMPKTEIGENGFIAHFLDTEGNHVAFHSFK